jgi:hypothetical protein
VALSQASAPKLFAESQPKLTEEIEPHAANNGVYSISAMLTQNKLSRPAEENLHHYSPLAKSG